MTEEAINILKNERPHCGKKVIYSEEEKCEVYDMAIEALEKAEKYRWHDLRKNPYDLPKQDGEYYAYQYCYYCRTSDPDSEVCEPMYTIIFVKDGKIDNCYDGGEIIAWKEIGPFETES